MRAATTAAAAAALPLALRALSYTDRILDRDETYWMAAALRMRAADLPVYVAGWDTKPPLAFLFHRLALAVAPGAPMLAAHVLAAALAAAACALTALAARRLAGDAAGLLAALFFALLDSSGPVRALAANTELLTYVPVAALALAIAADRPRGAGLPFLVGAASALAFLGKHPAALYAPAGCAAILLARREVRTVAGTVVAGLAGVAAVLGIAFAWLAAAGAWRDFVACNVTISGHRAKFSSQLGEQFGYARWLAVAWANAVALAGIGAIPVLALGRGPAAAPSRAALAVAGPLLVAGLVGALAGGAAFQHYLQIAYVPAAILAGAGVAAVATRLRRGPAWAVPAAAALAAVAVAAPDRLRQWRSRDWAGYDGGPVPALCARIHELTGPGDPIQVWGIHPDLYVTCRRAPASRFVTTNWLVGTYTGLPATPDTPPFEFVPGSWDLFLADLDASRPPLVVDSEPAGVHSFGAYPIARFAPFRAWLEERYVREDGPGGYVLWRRKGR